MFFRMIVHSLFLLQLKAPAFSFAFPSQDSLNPGFPSGTLSHDGSIPVSRFPSTFSSGISAQEVSKLPTRLSSPFSSGFSSQDGPNTTARFPCAFSSGLLSQDGPNPPRLPSAFSSEFSSQDGSNQSYGSAYQDNLLRDTVLGGNSNHYQFQFGRHASDMEFDDPATLDVGKGLMPAIGDSGLEMKIALLFKHSCNYHVAIQGFNYIYSQMCSLIKTWDSQILLSHMTDNYLAS